MVSAQILNETLYYVRGGQRPHKTTMAIYQKCLINICVRHAAAWDHNNIVETNDVGDMEISDHDFMFICSELLHWRI